MKFTTPSFAVKLTAIFSLVMMLGSVIPVTDAACDDISLDLSDTVSRMSFSGFSPTVERFTNTGVGNMIVLKGFTKEPTVQMVDGVMSVSAGDYCSADGAGSADEEGDPSSAFVMAKKVFGLTIALALGQTLEILPPMMATSTAGLLGVGMTLAPGAAAQDSAVLCELDPIEVEIYIDATADEIVMRNAQSGNFETCPPESLYWKHHPDVYGGFEGCVGEKAYFPCAQDSQGVWEEDGALYSQYPLNFDGESGECVSTGYSLENRTFWILWGDPLDKAELNERTGLNPVVSFPFNRGPYPRYEVGVPIDTAIDDSSDARAAAKDFLVYLGGFTAEELEAYDVTFTEGAESGMAILWAGKVLEIAKTTCNRDIFALVEVPAYGYSNSDAAWLVNKFSDDFYNGEECQCFNTTSCNDPTVTITTRGWLPLTPLPVEMGGDGNMYAADSDSPASPWFESLVFPENPSGKIKTTQLPNANRRVCDGVYLWPMYFGMRDYKIPVDERPDCSGWSFSITKAYSASVRAGFVIYKNEPAESHDAFVQILQDTYSMTNGHYSEWSWYGQMQLWDMIMSRPVNDPTSWIGAYSEIMEEKWSTIIEGFQDCPVVEISNPRAGAYVWFVYKAPFLGIQGGFVSSFFRDVLGVRTTTYNWGFRGADPADFYGEGYGVEDFTRLQLYRDVNIYTEVARRAKIVCADPDATIGNFISVNQWAAGMGTTTRRLTDGYADMEERKNHLVEFIPDIEENQLEYLAHSHKSSDQMDREAAACGPDFTTSCLFDKVGTRFSDF